MPEFKYKHGLSIMRAQPFHIGHAKMIDKMLRECEQVTIVLGSIQEQGTERNPLNYTTRKKMIQNVYRNRPEYLPSAASSERPGSLLFFFLH